MSLTYRIFGIPKNVGEVVDAVGDSKNTIQISLGRDIGSPSFLEGFVEGTKLNPCVRVVNGDDEYTLTSKNVDTVRGYATQIRNQLSKKGISSKFTEPGYDIESGIAVM
ncbi:MAG: hypothetical protein PVJ67_07070 [Candidatus Pacearchaeota archaeon]|jgi:hypothetical protein